MQLASPTQSSGTNHGMSPSNRTAPTLGRSAPTAPSRTTTGWYATVRASSCLWAWRRQKSADSDSWSPSPGPLALEATAPVSSSPCITRRSSHLLCRGDTWSAPHHGIMWCYRWRWGLGCSAGSQTMASALLLLVMLSHPFLLVLWLVASVAFAASCSSRAHMRT